MFGGRRVARRTSRRTARRVSRRRFWRPAHPRTPRSRPAAWPRAGSGVPR